MATRAAMEAVYHQEQPHLVAYWRSLPSTCPVTHNRDGNKLSSRQSLVRPALSPTRDEHGALSTFHHGIDGLQRPSQRLDSVWWWLRLVWTRLRSVEEALEEPRIRARLESRQTRRQPRAGGSVCSADGRLNLAIPTSFYVNAGLCPGLELVTGRKGLIRSLTRLLPVARVAREVGLTTREVVDHGSAHSVFPGRLRNMPIKSIYIK